MMHLTQTSPYLSSSLEAPGLTWLLPRQAAGALGAGDEAAAEQGFSLVSGVSSFAFQVGY